MQLRVRSAAARVPHARREALKRRLRMALGRTAAGVTATEAVFSKAPAPWNGTHCRISASLQDGSQVEVEDHGASLEQAAASAFWKLTQRLERIRACSREAGCSEAPRKRA